MIFWSTFEPLLAGDADFAFSKEFDGELKLLTLALVKPFENLELKLFLLLANIEYLHFTVLIAEYVKDDEGYIDTEGEKC